MSTSAASALTPSSTLTLHTGRTIPRLGYGVYKAAGSECADGVSEALKVGWKMIDSAQMYHNEHICGRSIASASPTPARASLYLTSKYIPAHPSQEPHSTEHIRQAARQSAEQFDQLSASEKEGGKPHLDLLLLHTAWGGEKERARIWAALAQSQEEGVTRDVGVSNFTVAHLSSLPAPLPAVNQLELHPWCQQRDIVAYCQSKGIILQAYAAQVRADPKLWSDPVLQQVVKKHGKGEAQVLLRWSLQKGYVPLVKSTNAGRIKQNFDVFDFELDEQDMAALDGLDRGKEGSVTWNPLDAE